jgi:hypothetical protein
MLIYWTVLSVEHICKLLLLTSPMLAALVPHAGHAELHWRWHDFYLQSNDDMRRGYYGVNDCVGHGSVAAAAADGDLELLAGPHERAWPAAQRARGQEGPHVQSKDCTHPFQGS